MKPNTNHSAREVVQQGWVFKSDAQGNLPNGWIEMAAQLEIARALYRIEMKMEALGRDGLHQLVREQLVEVRAKKKSRLARQRRTRRHLKAVP